MLEEIAKATGGRVISGTECAFTGLSIDSRTIKEGELLLL